MRTKKSHDRTEAKIIGARMKEMRKRLKITLKDMGKSLGVTGQSVWSYENGRFIPNAVQLIAICRILKVSPNQLLNINKAEKLDNGSEENFTVSTDGPAAEEAIKVGLPEIVSETQTVAAA